MTMETSDIPLRDATILDRLTSPVVFEALARDVESMMLSSPLERTPVAEYSGERALLAHLGAHGLRVALEINSGAEYGFPDLHIRGPLDMLCRPEEFVDQETPGVAEWAVDFGDALLKEAYTCLGKDAEQKLTEYREATTAEEQLAIIMWLDERLRAMQEPTKYKRGGVPDDILFYHPLRLSPKVIGVYPNINIPPTCLGFSIIATSFLYSAGAPTLHAGVMRTDNETDVIDSCDFSWETADDIATALGYDTDFSNALRENASLGYDALTEADNGYHAVALTRLIDGRWAQLDPNYEMTQVVSVAGFNNRMTTAFDELAELATVAPLLEETVQTQFQSIIKMWRDAYSPGLEVHSSSIDALHEAFTDDDNESLPRRIREIMVEISEYIHKDDDMETDIAKLREELNNNFFFNEKGEDVDVLSDTSLLGNDMYTLISKYVLYEQDVAEFKQRCRTDERFLTRRVTDVLTIIMAQPAIEAALLISGNRKKLPHIVYEVGRPAPRVAMTVLSDFAALMANDPLPPTFWHGTWPSLVPITDSAPAAHSPAQREAVIAMANITEAKTLQYFKDCGMVLYAEQTTTPEE